MVGPLLGFQQNLIPEVAGGRISQAFGLDGQTSQQVDQGLLDLQVMVNHHPTAMTSAVSGVKQKSSTQAASGDRFPPLGNLNMVEELKVNSNPV